MSQKTIQNLIVALVAFAVVIGGAVFMLVNVVTSSGDLEQQIAALAEQSQQEASLLRLQKLSQSSETEREELASYFLLREGDSIAFLSEIETLAPSLGIDLETTTLAQVERDDRNWIQVTFNAQGTRQDVQNFVQILEIIPYVSRVISVNMEQSGTSWSAEIVIQVQLLTYDQ